MYSIVASRSMALASAALECWPEGTIHTSDDVVVNGCSLSRAARAEPTPSVRIGAAGGLWRLQARSPQRFITVVLTRVEQIERTGGTHRPQIWVDAELDHCRPIFSAARIVGREASSHRKRMQLLPHALETDGWVRLPADVAAGDLLAVPCDGAIPIGEVRRSDHHRELPSAERFGSEPWVTGQPDDAEVDLRDGPRCLK